MNYQTVDISYFSHKLVIECLPQYGQCFPHFFNFAVISLAYAENVDHIVVGTVL